MNVGTFAQCFFSFLSPPFYTNHAWLPNADTSLLPKIQENPKVYPFFKDAVGALDRTHLSCNVTAVEQQTAQDHKGTITQNCLAMCDFDLKFLYMFSGWDGSTADFTMFHDTHLTDLFVLQGKYYLTNAGFPTCDSLSLHYYLAEWG